MRLNGQMTHTTYTGGTTGQRFLEYLKDILIPTLHKGDIVVMDNMRSHHLHSAHALIGILQDILQGIAFFHADKAETFHKFAVIVFDD